MDKEIDHMVPKNFGTAKIIVESKTETCHRSVELSVPIPIGEKCFFYVSKQSRTIKTKNNTYNKS